ncbi:MAG: hypothetical protein AAGG75_13555 [Bacteroidota bacterium]
MKSTKHLLQSFICIITLALCISCGHEHGPDTHTHDSEEASHSHSHDSKDASHSHSHAPGERGDGHSHYNDNKAERPPFTYLTMNGEFHLNPGDSMSQNDPRNPGRLILETSDEKGSVTKMTFFDHTDIEKKLAECGYQFIGSRPDPHYYPEQSKTSIWDVFEKVEDFSGDCSNYKYVLSRSPHGDPIHMHLRYGNDIEGVLAMSNDAEDDQFNPWWATYCDIDRTTACD